MYGSKGAWLINCLVLGSPTHFWESILLDEEVQNQQFFERLPLCMGELVCSWDIAVQFISRLFYSAFHYTFKTCLKKGFKVARDERTQWPIKGVQISHLEMPVLFSACANSHHKQQSSEICTMQEWNSFLSFIITWVSVCLNLLDWSNFDDHVDVLCFLYVISSCLNNRGNYSVIISNTIFIKLWSR